MKNINQKLDIVQQNLGPSGTIRSLIKTGQDHQPCHPTNLTCAMCEKTMEVILIRGKQDRISMKYVNPCSLKCRPYQSQLQLKWKIHPNNWVNIETYIRRLKCINIHFIHNIRNRQRDVESGSGIDSLYTFDFRRKLDV